jgi:hypothetical protein
MLVGRLGRESGGNKPFFLGSSSSIAAGLVESRLLDIGVEDITCVARALAKMFAVVRRDA